MKKIAIIGSGYTGIIAARELSLKYDVTVFESMDSIGGMTATFKTDGDKLENYYRHIFKSDSYVLGLMKEFGIEKEMLWPKTKMGYFTDGKIYEFGTPISLLKFKPLNLIDKFRFGLSILRLKTIKDYRKLENISAHEWLMKVAGKNAYEKIWEPLLISKFGNSYKDVSMTWMWGKIVLRGSSNEKDGESLGYLDGSYQVLTDYLEKDLKKRKVKINCGNKVDKVKKEDGKYTIVASKKKYKDFDFVVSTVAYPYFQDFANPFLTKKEKHNLSLIKYTGAKVMILFMKKSFMPFYWLNNGDKKIPFGGLIEHTNFIDKSKYNNENILYISNYMFHGDPLFKKNKEELFKIYLPMLKKINKEFSEKDVIRIELFTENYAQPIITKNYSKILPSLKIEKENIFNASMPQIYPEDRGLNYAIKLGYTVVKELEKFDKE